MVLVVIGATYTDEQIRQTVKAVYEDTGYLLDPHGACGYRALSEQLQPGETGVFLETAHPAKFLQTVESIIEDKVAIPEKLQEFMKGVKQSVPMSKDFDSFLETAHPAKFLQTVESIIEDKVAIPEKLQEFMKGVKQSVPMSKDFDSFKCYLMSR